MSNLTKRMNRLGKIHASQQEEKRRRKRNQLAAQNYAVEQKQQQRRYAKAVRTNRQIQKQVGNSTVGRALMGAVYGFNTGMAPLSYANKAKKLGYASYTPSAAAKERGDTSKKTAAFNKSLESSGAYKKSRMAGNMLATALQFAMGGGATKALGSKLLGTGAAKAATKKATQSLATHAIASQAAKEGVKKTLRDRIAGKVVSRAVQNLGRNVTKSAMKSASKRIVDKIAQNVAQDVAGDVTIGLYRDLAQARENGVDIKNPKQLVPYLAKQAGMNTLIGGVTNAAGPTLGAMRRNGKLWKTVERKVKDASGKTHIRYEKVLKNAGRGKTARQTLGDVNDIVSMRLGKTRRIKNAKVKPESLKRSAVAEAVNNGAYVSEIRRKGIDGMSVRDYAKKHNKSIQDVIAEDYQKRYGRTLEQSRRINRPRVKNKADVTAELTKSDVGTRAVNRARLRSAYETANPNSGKYRVRNENGRLVRHRLTEDDVMRANYMKVNGAPNIKAQRVAAKQAAREADEVIAGTASRAGRFQARYVPTYDINDIDLARKLQESQVRKFAKRDLGTDDLVEYGRKHNMEPMAVYNMEKDKLAGQLGARRLTAAEQDAFRNAPDELQAAVSRQTRQRTGSTQVARQSTQNAEFNAQTARQTNPDISAGRSTARQTAESFEDQRAALERYMREQPEYQKYNQIDALEAEKQRIIDSKKSVNDSTGNARLDEIEDELDKLGRNDPYYETRRSDVAKKIGSDYTNARNAQPDTVTTPNGTPIDVTDVNGRTGRQAVEGEAFAPDTNGAPDVTQGGRRSGEATRRSDAADTVAYMSGNTPKETKEINDYLKEIGADRTYHQSNADAIAEAAQRINDDTLNGAHGYLKQKYQNGGEFNNVDIAEGMTAMNRYNDLERAALDRGDEAAAKAAAKNRDEIAAVMSMELSETGKRLQAAKLFHKMSPDGRVNSVLMMKTKVARQTGTKNLRIDQDLLDMLRDARTVKDQQQIQDAISKQVWDQIPSTLTEKLAGWRYLSMLGNPKTHIRNVMGNAIFAPTRGLKNMLGAGIEKLDPRVQRGQYTKAILNPLSKNDNRLINKGIQEWDNVKDDFLSGSAKYDLGLRRPEDSRIFKNRLIQGASDINSNLLNAEDEVFAKYAYTHAYAQYLKANKIDLATASDEVLEAARKNAWDEALTATYRESNALADIINAGRKNANISFRDIANATGSERNKLLLKKAGGTAVDAMVPFAKTPANIMKSGVAYSPAGIIHGIGQMVTARNAQDVVKAIDSLSKGTVGSGTFALGAYLAHKGWANASINQDDQGYYDFDRGKQEYAITIGNNTLKAMDWFDLLNSKDGHDESVSLDWAVPDAMALFSGVEAYNAAVGSGDDGDITDKATRAGQFFANMLKMSDPVLEMSMLSSLKNAFDNSKSGENGNSALLQTGTNIVQSRLGQYVPTILGQATKTMEQNQRSSTSAMDGSLKSWDSFVKQQMNKVPGLTKLNPEKTDAFGNKKEHKETAANYAQSLLKNMFSPANIKQVRNTGVDKELQRLVNEGQAAENVLPRTAYKGMMDKGFGDLNFKIGAKEVAKFNEYRGTAAMKNLTKLFKSKTYKDASNEDKTKLIKDAYEQATETAKKKFAGDQGVTGYKYDYGTLSDSAKKKYDSKLKELREAGSNMDKKSYMKIFKKAYGYGSSRPDAWDNGKYVAKTLLAARLNGGNMTFDEAKITTSANKTTWQKVVNLYKRGYKASQALKYTITEDEKNQCSYEDRNGNMKLDERKLALFINKMNISQEEKWARFEVNRYANFRNPF